MKILHITEALGGGVTSAINMYLEYSLQFEHYLFTSIPSEDTTVKNLLVNFNTFELINGAIEFWPINSTVGLESMIVGKEVTFEGNSIYRSMAGNRLAAYIMKYLVKIEYFSNENITKEQFDDFFDESRFLL